MPISLLDFSASGTQIGLYDTTLGTILVGIFFNTFLYGLVTYQFAAYYRTTFNDQPVVKYMVLFLFILDTFHSISAIYAAWYYTVTNYDNPAALSVIIWPYTFTPTGTVLAALAVQVYLGFRIWYLTSSKVLYWVAILLATSSSILGITTSIEAWTIKTLSGLPRITNLVIATLSMRVVVDMFITTTLVIVFSRSRTGFRKTDTVLNRLIRGAIQTGLFASIFSICNLITFVVLPNTTLYFVFAIPIGRIYTNTLLDILLVRESFRAEINGTDHASGALGSLAWAATELSETTSSAQTTSTQPEEQTPIPGTRGRGVSQRGEGKVIPLEV